jgi:autotransporter-associated beta strand protein
MSNRTAKRLDDPMLSNRAFAIFFVVTILIAIGLLLAPKAGAANDLYWDTNGTTPDTGNSSTGTWGTSNFWNTDSTGGAGTLQTTTTNTNDVHFSAGAGSNGTVTINLAQSANSIIFEDASITLSGGTSITLGGGGGVNSGLLFVSGTNANTISTALVLGSAAAFTNNDNTVQTISGGVTGGFNLTINGSGAGGFTFSTGSVNNGGSITNSGTGTGTTTISSVIGSNVTTVTENSSTSKLTLSGVNQYTGGTTVTAGTLELSGSGTLGSTTGTLTVNGGTLDLNTTSQTVGALNGGSGGTITSSGAGNASLTVGNGGASDSYSGTITDQNSNNKRLSLTKTGAGTQTLSGNNTYTGGTTVSNGTLLANNTAGSGTGTGAVTVNNSGTVLGGTGTISGGVTVNANAKIQGGNGTTGTTLTLTGALTLADNSIIQLALGPSSMHSTLARTGAGTWTFDSNQAFTFIDLGATTGTYQNIITAIADPPSEGSWTITNPGFVGTFTYDGANIDLTLTAVPEPSTWAAGALALASLVLIQRGRISRFLKRRP